MVGLVILTIVTVTFPAPDRLPDLFAVLISVYSCGHFILFLMYFHYCQFTARGSSTPPVSKKSTTQKPNDKNSKVMKQAQPKLNKSKKKKVQ